MVVRAFIWGHKEESDRCSGSYTLYSLNIYHNSSSSETHRRYREFFALNDKLKAKIPKKPLLHRASKFPPKQLLFMGKEQVIQTRMNSLNSCLAQWTQDPEILACGYLHEFLGLSPPKGHQKRRPSRSPASIERKYRIKGRSRVKATTVLYNPLGAHPHRPETAGKQSLGRSHTVTMGQLVSPEWKFVQPRTPPCLQASSCLRNSSRQSTLCTVPEHTPPGPVDHNLLQLSMSNQSDFSLLGKGAEGIQSPHIAHRLRSDSGNGSIDAVAGDFIEDLDDQGGDSESLPAGTVQGLEVVPEVKNGIIEQESPSPSS